MSANPLKRLGELGQSVWYDYIRRDLYTGPKLQKGMFFTVEPMINLGRPEVKVLNDGWTAVTRDKTLTAQCEHSVGVTDDGVEIFTASATGQFRPLPA